MTKLLLKAAIVPLGAVLLAAVQVLDTSASVAPSVDDLASGPPSTGRAPCTPRTTPADVTDRNVRPEPPLPPLPPAGGTFRDPAFGKTLMRLTDENDGPDNQVGYSYWPTFNKDSTRAAISTGQGQTRTLVRLDPVSFTLLGKEEVPPSPSGQMQWDDAIWSSIETDLIFGHTPDGKLWSYDAGTRQYDLVKDFAPAFPGEYQWQMSKSLDDNVFAFTRRELDTFDVLGYMAWRRDTDQVLLNESTTDVNEVQIDKTGRWLYVVTQQEGQGAIVARVADLSTGVIVADLTDDAPDQAPSHHDSGRGILVGASNWINAITFRSFATPHQFTVMLDLGGDWSQALHSSLLAEDERWAIVSFFGMGGDGLFHREIVQVATDGSQRVRRLAHHRSLFAEYYDAPRANASRDGCFVAFTSNWGGSGRRDVFILNVAR